MVNYLNNNLICVPTAPVPRTGLGTVQCRMADPSKEEESGHSFSVPQVHDTKPRTTHRTTMGLKTRCLDFRPAYGRCPLAFYPGVWWPAAPCSGQRHYCRPSGKKGSVRWLARLPLKSFAEIPQPASQSQPG